MAGVPIRLNLGCGFDKRPGFLNVDQQAFHEPDLVADITALAALPADHFELIVAQDVLEHLERDRVPAALAHWAGLLAPEGVLEVRVPSLLDLLQLLAAPAHRTAEAAAQIIQLVYGTQAYPGDYHQSGFTAAVLDDLLTQAGLRVCDAALLDGWLFQVRARRTAALRDPGELVHQAFFQLLGRPADPVGLAYFVERLRDARLSPEALRAILAESAEAQALARYPRYLVPYVAGTVPGSGPRVA
jgi:hypothetical protein